MGPYAVAHLRVTERIQARGGALPEDGAHVYLSDTLESPHSTPSGQMALPLRSLAQEHERARQIKAGTQVLVCLGNPPYNRQEIDLADEETRRRGGWVRFGEQGVQVDAGDAAPPILNEFLEPARRAGAGVHLKNLYNDYVYFWRWALWKVFESTGGPGIVSFITAASYLRGPGFVGMREAMRRTFDELWIMDLEGDSLGARKTENVFAIRTPVAIAIGVRYARPKRNKPATTQYVRLTGSADEKLVQLDRVRRFTDLDWQECFDGWHEPLLPTGSGDYFVWPLLTDIFPWQQAGIKLGRTWPISASVETLQLRWRTLLDSAGSERRRLFKESPTGRRLDSFAKRVTPHSGDDLPLYRLDQSAPTPNIVQMGFRSMDRQWVIADGRLMDRSGPSLWHAHSYRQVYITSLLTGVLGLGPAAMAAAHIPDLHHFCNRGGKDVIPLWRDADASEPNVADGLLAQLGETLGFEVGAEGLFAYCYALLASPDYVEEFSEELTIPGPRIPLTKDPAIFRQGAALGKDLIRLHTYGERFAESGRQASLQGFARCTQQVGETETDYPLDFEYNEARQTLRVGAGKFGPVRPEVWEFSVSGFQVVKSWLGYRIRDGSGRRSSPLDDIRPTRWTAQFTHELLQLLWVLEATVERQPALAELLEEVVAGECFGADELPEPEAWEREAPRIRRTGQESGTYRQTEGLG